MATVQEGMIVPGLLEESRRKIMDGLRLLIAVDNYAAVKIRDLHKETRSKKVVRPSFTTDFSGAVLRDGAGELTFRAHEEGVLRTFIDTANVGWLTTTGTPSVRAFLKESKDQSGKPCIIDTRTCTKQCQKQEIGRKQEG